MKILVTGAAGFLGRSVVERCLARKHEVIAMVRPRTEARHIRALAGTTVLKGDLRQKGVWANELEGLDLVIHLAASVSGDLSTQFAGTVIGTENLLECLPTALGRIIQISSYSVYDYTAVRQGSALTEDSPTERRPEDRDAYTTTKLIQEEMVRTHCRENNIDLTVIRPGAIYGPGHEWEFGSAIRIGRFDLIFSPFAKMKLTHVDNCADAIAMAIDKPSTFEVINVVDSILPTHAGFHHLCRRAGASTGYPIYVPWLLVKTIGLFVRLVNQSMFRGGAKLPEVLDLPRQRARWKPLQYRYDKATKLLDWQPNISIAEGVAAMCSNGIQGSRSKPIIDYNTVE